MKSLMFLAGLLAVSTASAATITCTPTNNNVINNSTFVALPLAFNCAGTAAAGGNVITSVAIEVFISFQDAVAGGAHQLQATATEASAEIVGSVATQVTTVVNDNVAFAATVALGGTAPASSGAVANLGSLAGFVINVNALSLGTLIPDNGSITVAYTTTETPTGGQIPEPSSLLLLGSGFLALGLAARRRISRS